LLDDLFFDMVIDDRIIAALVGSLHQ